MKQSLKWVWLRIKKEEGVNTETTSTTLSATELARRVQTKLGLPYVYSALGQRMTEELIRSFAKAYPSVYTSSYLAKTLKAVGKQAFDCVGLIKFFVWGNTGDKLLTYNPATDISANNAYNRATVKGTIKTIPETPGVCVWLNGHIGVYIGGGYVIEARGVDYGVVKTKLAARPWTHWLCYPGVDYGRETSQPAQVNRPMLRRGSKGAAVKEMQSKLIASGFSLLRYGVDGDFGSETDAAVRAFQKTRGLTVDGICGPKTWSALAR